MFDERSSGSYVEEDCVDVVVGSGDTGLKVGAVTISRKNVLGAILFAINCLHRRFALAH